LLFAPTKFVERHDLFIFPFNHLLSARAPSATARSANDLSVSPSQVLNARSFVYRRLRMLPLGRQSAPFRPTVPAIAAQAQVQAKPAGWEKRTDSFARRC